MEVGARRVLVVDDEELILAAIVRILGRSYEVHVCRNAAGAIHRILSGQRYDLILTDMSMPGLSGLDLFLAIQRCAPEQAHNLVLMTGETRERAAIANTVNREVLEKPFHPNELREFVARAVDRSIASG